MMVGLHHHPDLLPLQGQLTAATSRQNRSSNRRGLSLDSYIGRLSLKGTWKGILEVSAFLVYYITILCSSTSQITRTSQQVWRVHLVYVASGITSSRITQPCGPTSLPTGNRAPSGAVIFSRVECFNLSRHIRRRTDQPVAPHPQADRPTFHYRTCIKHTSLPLLFVSFGAALIAFATPPPPSPPPARRSSSSSSSKNDEGGNQER